MAGVAAVRQYDVHIVCLDPTVGSEIRKSRPCAVLSPDEMNGVLNTVQLASLTTSPRRYPWRVALTFRGKPGLIALDQIRTVDKRRLVKRVGGLSPQVVMRVKAVLHKMLVQ